MSLHFGTGTITLCPNTRIVYTLILNTNGHCIRDRNYHSVPKYKDRLYINIEYKRSLYFGTATTTLSQNIKIICASILWTNLEQDK